MKNNLIVLFVTAWMKLEGITLRHLAINEKVAFVVVLLGDVHVY
jgi:hypothetical protein